MHTMQEHNAEKQEYIHNFEVLWIWFQTTTVKQVHTDFLVA